MQQSIEKLDGIIGWYSSVDCFAFFAGGELLSALLSTSSLERLERFAPISIDFIEPSSESEDPDVTDVDDETKKVAAKNKELYTVYKHDLRCSRK